MGLTGSGKSTVSTTLQGTLGTVTDFVFYNTLVHQSCVAGQKSASGGPRFEILYQFGRTG